MKTTFELIYDVVRKIPRGCVATYGQIATLAGNPRWSRVVGYALHVNPEPGVIPCHRVVTAWARLPPRSRSAARICKRPSLKRRAWSSMNRAESIFKNISGAPDYLNTVCTSSI